MSKLQTLRAFLVAVVSLLWLLAATPALAEPAPRWQLSVTSIPTHLPPGGEGQIVVLGWNLGGASEGAPVTITDDLPPGVTATSIHGATEMAGEGLPESLNPMSCTLVPTPTCTWSKATALLGESLTAYGTLRVTIDVKVEGPQRTATDEAGIEGGEAPSDVVSQPLSVNSSQAPFGFEKYEFRPENADGSLDTQAGSHPFALTTTLGLNSTFEAGVVKPVAMARDLHVELPPGLIGDPRAVPECTLEEFTTNLLESDFCPPETAVGIALVTVREPTGHLGTLEPTTKISPVFNLTPAPGEPARLGFVAAVVPVVLDTSLRSGGDYGVTVINTNIPETAELLAARVIVWGVPGDPRHNTARGWECLKPTAEEPCPAPNTSQPFLTLPTSCEHPLESSVDADSWPTPGNKETSEVAAPLSYILRGDAGEPVTLTGCDRLPFTPTMTVAPDTQAASAPTGLKVSLSVPQETTLAPSGLAEADVKDTTVALPEGMQVNPASVSGLQACSGTPSALAAGELGSPGDEIGFTGFQELGGEHEPGVSTATFTPYLPGSLAAKGAAEHHEIPESEAALQPGLNFCPEASKVGVVHIKTPLLPRELEGGVYLAAQNANPFGSLIALYIIAQDPEAGVLVKLAGEVTLDGRTGQLVSTFLNTPQLPFEELNLELFGGADGSLSTPSRCGVYQTTASLTPWSDAPPVNPTSVFEITSGPKGSPCPGSSLPFAPSLVAGTTNNQAGAFSPLTTTISREDGNENIQAVSLHMPAGLSGLLTGVKLCEERQAEEGLCGPESLIGETTVSVGVGDHPYTVTGGKVFITGPYQGAPFGLSIATPAKAGPFDLEKNTPCDCVVVRAKVEVDPHTAVVTIASSAIPHIIEGIPLQIKDVDVTVDRPGFEFNPTNCSPLAITGTISSIEGASSALSIPFQAANCATLKFAPNFSVSTSAHTSKADGASLTTKLVYPTAPQGTQANIAMTKVDLPKILPSRLTTLQKACLAVVFEASPESCPAASVVGHATVTTPVLPVPLTGPAYLVSHGGEAFPALTMVLKGYGVTIDLVGTTFISKSGITSTTFKTVPDTPFNTFELTLPEGKYSALAANGNLCKHKLVMPTAFVAQNGAEIKQETQIAVTGCPTAISISSHKVSGKTTTLSVYVPAAGELTASGKGLVSASKPSKGQEDVTIAVSQKRAGKLKTKIKLTFTPSKGKKQSKNLTVEFKR